MMAEGHLILGIDIGTTSVKVCVVDVSTGEVVAQQNKDTQANVPSDLGREGNKQNVPKIISALQLCISRLPKDLLRKVQKIGICGQMHGVMLWQNGDTARAWEQVVKDDGSLLRYDIPEGNVSNLYTWQDSRCEPAFLKTLPPAQSHLPTYTGYGCATLFWMAKHKPEKFKKYNRAGTIQDFAVAILCEFDKPIMSVQNAASWGYFNCSTKQWNEAILKDAGFPVDLLPKVVESGDIVGELCDNWYSIPKGTPVGVALGDLQCSVLSTLEKSDDAVINISTSAQLAFVAEDFVPTDKKEIGCLIEHFPYFKGKYLAVAASLNGGNSLAAFIRMLQQWVMELGFSAPQSKIWEKVMGLALNADTSSLKISPTLLGERHSPEKYASVENINLGNLGLGQVFRALCHGVIENVHRMMPREVLVKSNIKRIVGNGSGLSRNKVLQHEVQQFYGVPLVFTNGGDAAKGAAMALANH